MLTLNCEFIIREQTLQAFQTEKVVLFSPVSRLSVSLS